MLTIPRKRVKALEETVELLVREVPEIVGILQYKGVRHDILYLALPIYILVSQVTWERVIPRSQTSAEAVRIVIRPICWNGLHHVLREKPEDMHSYSPRPSQWSTMMQQYAMLQSDCSFL